MRVEKDYEELLELFNKNKVRYCIIGAFAIGLYGKPRYTKDMDILVEPQMENAQRIIRSLDAFGFKTLGLTEKDFSRKDKVIQLGYEPVRIDLITSVKGCSFKEIWKNRRAVTYGKQRVFFIGKRELIKIKKAANRKQDKADLEILLRAQKGLSPKGTLPLRG